MNEKLRDYFAHGTRLVWYVDPRRRTVKVFTSTEHSRTLGETEMLDGGDVLPGFQLEIPSLFADLPQE
jgi:Uma2 family endonuclease